LGSAKASAGLFASLHEPQQVTLYLTPVVYIYMSAAQERVQSWRRRKPVQREAPVAG